MSYFSSSMWILLLSLYISSQIAFADPTGVENCKPGNPSTYWWCCQGADPKLTQYCNEYKKKESQKPKDLSPDKCRSFDEKIEVSGYRFDHPPKDQEPRDISANYSKNERALRESMNPPLSSNEAALGLTNHTMAIGPTAGAIENYPFVAVDIRWQRGSSEKGTFECAAIESIHLYYNPITVFIPYEFMACQSGILSHEIKHVNRLAKADYEYAQVLRQLIQEQMSPTLRNPAKINSAEHFALFQRRALIRFKELSTQAASIAKYEEAWKENKGYDSPAETARVCASCTDWPSGVCRRK